MRKLSDLAEINPKRHLPDGLSAKDEVSFIPMSDVTESGEWACRQTRQLKELLFGFTLFLENDVLFAKITPCMENGKGAHAVDLKNGVGFGSTEFHVLRAKSGASARFIFHVCQSRRLRLAAEAHMIGSAGQQRVQKQFFDRYDVFDPPAAEQQKIAKILDTLDTQIRQTEALIAKLERIKQGLLTDLLTRGIDQNGQLRPTPDKAPHLYKDSPLGRIPREWDAKSLGAVVKLQGGYAFSSESFQEHGVRLARISNIKDGSIAGDFASLPPFLLNRFADYSANEGDVLIAMSGATTGKMAVVDASNLPMLLNQRVGRFVVMECDHVLPSFLTFLLGTSFFKQQIEIAAIGGAQPNISGRQIESIVLAFPPTGEQRKIETALQAFGKRMHTERALVKTLYQGKAGLMDDLLTGRVRVTPLLDTAEQAYR